MTSHQTLVFRRIFGVIYFFLLKIINYLKLLPTAQKARSVHAGHLSYKTTTKHKYFAFMSRFHERFIFKGCGVCSHVVLGRDSESAVQ